MLDIFDILAPFLLDIMKFYLNYYIIFNEKISY